MEMKPYGRKARNHGRSAAQYATHHPAPHQYYAAPIEFTVAAASATNASNIYSPYPPPADAVAYFPSPHPQQPYFASYTTDKVTLESMVRKQIEYYLSEENLIKDVFLRKKMDKEGFVLLSEIASFQRVSYLTKDMEIIVSALKESETIEICDENGIKIRPKKDPHVWPVPPELQLQYPAQPQAPPQMQQQLQIEEQLQQQQQPQQPPLLQPQIEQHATRLPTQHQQSQQQKQHQHHQQHHQQQHQHQLANTTTVSSLQEQPELELQLPQIQPQQQQSHNQKQAQPGQTRLDASSSNNSNSSDISSITTDNNNRSSLTYATAVTNKSTTASVDHHHHNNVAPTNGPTAASVVAGTAAASTGSSGSSNSSSTINASSHNNNKAPTNGHNNHHQPQQQKQTQSQQQPIGDIPNNKHNKSGTPVESEWKEVKSRRRRPGKVFVQGNTKTNKQV